MSEKEIKEYLKRVDELELKLTGDDKDTLQWLIFGYNECARILEETEQENQQLKEQLENASKNYTKYIQERDNVLDEIRELVSHFSGGQICECSKELGMQIEKILDKVGSNE